MPLLNPSKVKEKIIQSEQDLYTEWVTSTEFAGTFHATFEITLFIASSLCHWE